jgi:hypothetical protein
MTAPHVRARTAIARAATAAILLAGLADAGGPGGGFPAAAAEFVRGLGDVPAMPGLAPVDGGDLIFDKPGGRIAETVMRGRVGRADVQSFYASSMPQLGWERLSGDRFRREGEELRLEFVDSPPQPAGHTTVRFVLTPR